MVMSRSNEVNTMEWKTFSKHTKDYLDDEMSDVCVCAIKYIDVLD